MYERQPEHEQEYDYYESRPDTIRPLNRLDGWHIEQGRSDIRGWNVIDRGNDDIGNVDDLMVDTNTGEVVFALISFGGLLGMGSDKSLIPMDQLELLEDDKAKFHGTREDLENAPKYEEDTRNFGPFYDFWGGKQKGMEHRQTGAAEGRERVIPETQEHLEARTRTEQTGEVEVRKEVETREETIREPVHRTRIRVTRREVKPGREVRAGEQVLEEGEVLEIPVVEERLEAHKRREVTGEVVIEPEMLEEEEEITGEVRREHVEIETRGEADVEEGRHHER